MSLGVRHIKGFVIAATAILASATADAKVASWAVAPQYSDLARFHDNLFTFSSNGKYGILRSDGTILLQAENDAIWPFVNGYSIVGKKEGGRYMLAAVVTENGEVLPIRPGFYLPPKCKYFSEELLAVSDRSGKFGYIDPVGELTVKCQFDDALPFKEGLAPVQLQNGLWRYIDKRGRHLIVDFKNGDLTDASCFSGGNAAVGYNDAYALINSYGEQVRKLKAPEFETLYKEFNASPAAAPAGFSVITRYTPYSENGVSGLKEGARVALLPQFESFGEQYSDGLVIASKNGRQGLLSLSDSEVTFKPMVGGKATTLIEVDRKGVIPQMTVEIPVPSEAADFRVMLDDGSGSYSDVTSSASRAGQTMSVAFTPAIADGAETGAIRLTASNGDILLAQESFGLTVEYPVILRVSKPGPASVRANSDDMASVSATVHNDSRKSVTVTATWSTGKSVTLNLAPNSSKTLGLSLSVTQPFTRDIRLSLDTGESASSTIHFEPF